MVAHNEKNPGTELLDTAPPLTRLLSESEVATRRLEEAQQARHLEYQSTFECARADEAA